MQPKEVQVTGDIADEEGHEVPFIVNVVVQAGEPLEQVRQQVEDVLRGYFDASVEVPDMVTDAQLRIQRHMRR